MTTPLTHRHVGPYPGPHFTFCPSCWANSPEIRNSPEVRARICSQALREERNSSQRRGSFVCPLCGGAKAEGVVTKRKRGVESSIAAVVGLVVLGCLLLLLALFVAAW